jgi:hypothetical protein
MVKSTHWQKTPLGTASSVKQHGGKILVGITSNGLIAPSVLYDGGTMEHFVFQIDDRGDGTVISTLIRTAGNINK